MSKTIVFFCRQLVFCLPFEENCYTQLNVTMPSMQAFEILRRRRSLNPLFAIMLSISFRAVAIQAQTIGHNADTLAASNEDLVVSNQTERKTLSTVDYNLSVIATGSTNDEVPFWMRSNRQGDVPLPGASVSFAGRATKDYLYYRKEKLFDWGAGVEARVNLGKHAHAILIEAYLKGRIGIFQLRAGRRREVTGLVDTTLSSGSFSVSGNSLGIPKVELSIPEFYTIPFLWKILAVKGGFAHGWIGDAEALNGPSLIRANTFLHQKSLYAKLGRPNWKVKVLAGFNHQVFWGNEKKINGSKYMLSPWETYKRVIFGQSYGGDDVGLPRSKVGNHLGSIDQGVEIRTKMLDVFAYHQFFFEVGGLYHLNNVKDGLFGLSISNNFYSSSESPIRWKKILVEYIATKSQGGEINAKITPSGDEDYYNNYIYQKGWTYKGENIGNPLITSRAYAKDNLPMASSDYFVNNRLKAIQIGSEYSIFDWNLIMKLTYSLNYGSYGTSPWGHSLNNIRFPPAPPYFTETPQFSGQLTASRKLKRNVNISFNLALDRGDILYNSSGMSIKICKTW